MSKKKRIGGKSTVDGIHMLRHITDRGGIGRFLIKTKGIGRMDNFFWHPGGRRG